MRGTSSTIRSLNCPDRDLGNRLWFSYLYVTPARLTGESLPVASRPKHRQDSAIRIRLAEATNEIFNLLVNLLHD
jgi:hypothetical protein